ncbi:MAG: hypothetical protein ACK4WD_13735 [Flavobacteriales bacterium]
MRYLLLICCMLFWASCKKDDNDPPVVVLLEPTGSTFAYGSIIPIKFSVSDNANIEEVRVTVRNTANNQVLNSLVFFTEKNTETFQGEIAFNDVHVESGAYYIQIIASDGENEGAAIKNIQLQGAPLALEAILGLTDGNSSTTVFNFAANQWSYAFMLVASPEFSMIDSYDQRLMIAGNSSQGLLAFDAVVGTSIGQSPGLSIQESLWEDAQYDDEKRWWWLACNDGSIRAYNTLAVPRIQFNVIGNFFPHKIAITDEYIVAACSNINQSVHRLDTYLKSTGQLIHSMVTSSRVDHLATLSENRIWTYQSNEEMQQKVYDIAANYQDEWTNFRYAENGTILKVIKTSNSIAMLFNDQIKTYSLSGTELSSLNITATDISFEKLFNQIYAKTSGGWVLLNANTLAIANNLEGGETIDHLLFRYNK